VAGTALWLSFLAGPASAATPTVSVSATNPANNQTLTVSGSGFPGRSQDPTGVVILECADPGGSVANLPNTAMDCDGATENPLPVNVDASGNFTAQYTFAALSGTHGASNIACDVSHACVLWVGIDYNNAFLGIHAFSSPFRIGGPESVPSSSDTLVIVLPIVAVVLIGAALVVRQRRRSPGSAAGRTSVGSAPASS
jgi:hypothetical protein